MIKYLLGNNGEDLEKLFIASIKITKNSDLKKTLLKRIVFSIVLHIFSFFSILMILYKWNLDIEKYLLIPLLIILIPYSFLYHIKMRSILSWLSYASISKKKSTLEIASINFSEIAWNVYLYAIIEYSIINRATSDRDQGILATFTRIFNERFKTIFEIAENYLLPTITIEQIKIKNSLPKLNEIKDSIPKKLAAAFGYDFFESTVEVFSPIIYFLIILAGIITSYLLGLVLPDYFKFQLGGHKLFLIPLLMAIFLCSFIGNYIKIYTTSLKTIYYTIFYTMIIRPHEINKSIYINILNYLNHSDFDNPDTTSTDEKHTSEETNTNEINQKENVILQTQEIQELPKTLLETYNINPKILRASQKEMLKLRLEGKQDIEILNIFKKRGWPEDLITYLLEDNEII